MTQAEIDSAVRKLAYLKTPDKVRAGIRNTYGVLVPISRIERVLKAVQAEGAHRWNVGDPTESDGHDYDFRLSPRKRAALQPPVVKRDRPAFKLRAPLPERVPIPTPNPFDGPFQFKVLAASIARDFNVTAEDIISAKRFRKLILPRLVLTKLCIQQGMSCSNIGRKMGGRDHTTILHQRDIFDAYAALYPQVRASYERHVALREEARAARKEAA